LEELDLILGFIFQRIFAFKNFEGMELPGLGVLSKFDLAGLAVT